MGRYHDKMMTTKKTPGVQIVILTDKLKTGGDEYLVEHIRHGQREVEEEKAKILRLLRGGK